MSEIQMWPWPLPPRGVDPDGRPARGCGQVRWRGGEGPRHRCFVCLPEQGGGAGHRTLGHGAQPPAAGQPSGCEGTRALCCEPSTSISIMSFSSSCLGVSFVFMAECHAGQLSCKILCPEHVPGLILLGQQLSGLSAGGRRQCRTQRRGDELQGQTGGLHLSPAHRHLGWGSVRQVPGLVSEPTSSSVSV